MYALLTALFALGIAIQAYLAGLSIFLNASWLGVHGSLGFVLGDATLPLLLIALLARLPFRIVLLNIVLILDMLLQILLVTALRAFDQPILTAFHPANALALFLISLLLAASVLRWLRTTSQRTSPLPSLQSSPVSDLS